MVSSEQNYLFGVVDFECHDEGHDFDGVGAPVDVVAEEDEFSLALGVVDFGQEA